MENKLKISWVLYADVGRNGRRQVAERLTLFDLFECLGPTWPELARLPWRLDCSTGSVHMLTSFYDPGVERSVHLQIVEQIQ